MTRIRIGVFLATMMLALAACGSSSTNKAASTATSAVSAATTTSPAPATTATTPAAVASASGGAPGSPAGNGTSFCTDARQNLNIAGVQNGLTNARYRQLVASKLNAARAEAPAAIKTAVDSFVNIFEQMLSKLGSGGAQNASFASFMQANSAQLQADSRQISAFCGIS